MEILNTFLYGLLAIALLLAGCFIMDVIIPYDFRKEIFEEKNSAVGALVAGIFIAMGIIIRSAVIGG